MANWYKYESPLTQRYEKSSLLLEIFSERTKTKLWRQLWIWLAESLMELGYSRITPEMIAELEDNKLNIDREFILSEQKRLKHDVMAQIYAYAKDCPNAAAAINLGANSAYVQDNADLIRQRDALDYLIKKYANAMQSLAEFARKHSDTVCVGRTHWQTASLVTVGKRAVLWLQELLIVFNKLVHFRQTIRFHGAKGSTGTQDTFSTLFNGDYMKIQQLDDLITKKAGFTTHFNATGQTYPRQQDADLLFILSQFGAAADKICKDIRFLQSHNELMEAFDEEDQVGSSAMPYKRNPIGPERVCSLSRLLINNLFGALVTVADHGVERSFDDQEFRRIVIPDAFLCASTMLTFLTSIFEELQVCDGVEKNLTAELPFLALEKVMILLSQHGVNLQKAHAKILKIAMEARKNQSRGETVTIESILSDSFFDTVRDEMIGLVKNPINFAGLCVRQVQCFLNDEFEPAIKGYVDTVEKGKAHVNG